MSIYLYDIRLSILILITSDEQFMRLISAHFDYVYALNSILAFTLFKCLFIPMIIAGVMDPSLGYPPKGNSESALGSNTEVQQQDDSATNLSSYLIIRKDAHQKFIDIIRLLTDLAEQYSLENYLTADYDILHECTDGLDNAICDLQEESGWLTAVRTLTSLSCTSAIACHIYKEWE